jgi:hypothetical protein
VISTIRLKIDIPEVDILNTISVENICFCKSYICSMSCKSARVNHLVNKQDYMDN